MFEMVISAKRIIEKILIDPRINPSFCFIYYYDRMTESKQKVKFIDLMEVNDKIYIKKIEVNPDDLIEIHNKGRIIWKRVNSKFLSN